MAIPFIFTRTNVVLVFEVLMAMTVNVTALWAVTPCSLVDMYGSSRGSCYLHYKPRRITRAQKWDQGGWQTTKWFSRRPTQTAYQLVGVNTQYGRIHWYSTGGVSMLERAFNCVMTVVATLRDFFTYNKPMDKGLKFCSQFLWYCACIIGTWNRRGR